MGHSVDRHVPHYKLDYVKKLVAADKFMLERSAFPFMKNRYKDDDWNDVAKRVIDHLSAEDYYKTSQLEKLPKGVPEGTVIWADIYRGAWYDGHKWYVKFYYNEDGTFVLILSMYWDGMIH